MEEEVEAAGGEETTAVRMRSSIPSGNGNVWADVSPLIHAACSDLQDGELIHAENFSLFAAMSALEIMDPKMDSGMSSCGYYSIDEAIDDGAAPLPLSLDRTIDIHCCIDVMDHLIACEATWHKGHSLAQTLFSCIYLLRIERTSSHTLLHSYCRLIIATCSAVVSAVSDARTHEEEDLFTMAYGLPLKVEGDGKSLSLVNSVEETISRQLRACKASSSRKKVHEDIDTLQPNPDLEEGYCRALLCRLRFRKHFYHALICLRKPQGRGLDLARKHIATCLSELSSILKSQEFLWANAYQPHQTDAENSTTASGCRAVGFDASLNRRLSAPTPPRAIRLLSWKKAIEYFEKLLQDLDVICSIHLDSKLEYIKSFVVRFQKSQPDLVARAYLQLLLVQDGKVGGRDFFYDVISSAIASPEFSRDEKFQKNEFILQLVQLLVNLLKILCTNTSWQRRKLGKVLQDWSIVSIQLDLVLKRKSGEITDDSIDENLCMGASKHLLIWAEKQTYWIAARFLTLGFELELYSPNEYCMVYWYMYIVFVKLFEKSQLVLPSKNESSIRRKTKKKRDVLKDFSRDTVLSPYCLLLQCYICLSEGLAMMLAALSNEYRTFKIPSIFNSEQERFCQHFDLLLRAHVPDQVSYHLFKELTSHVPMSSVVQSNYFRDVQRIATSLRGAFSNEPDKLEELRQIEQVAEHNRIAINVINQAGSDDSALRISFEFTQHPFFAVAVVRRT